MEAIRGLSVPSGQISPQKIYLEVDSNKVCYATLPNGVVLTSNAGKIDVNYTGTGGKVLLVVPKNTASISTVNSLGTIFADFSGTFETHLAVTLYIFGNKITNVIAPNAIYVDFSSNVLCASFYAPKSVYTNASGCSLSANVIGDYFWQQKTNDPTGNGFASFSGINNADWGEVESYVLSTYAYSLDTLINTDLATWVITIDGNPV